MQRKTIAGRAGAALWVGWVVWWTGQAPSAPSGSQRQSSQSSQGESELGFPRPALWQMQSEAAGRALPVDHPDARKHLVFGDHLRTHPEAVREYELLKRELALKYRDDHRTHTDSKTDFIRESSTSQWATWRNSRSRHSRWRRDSSDR